MSASTASSTPARPATLAEDELASTAKYRERRQAILVAAAQAFNEQGLKGATLADVAGRVGLLKASVNYYYRRKEELAADAMMQAIEASQALIDGALQAKTPQAQLRALFSARAGMLADVARGTLPEPLSFNEIRSLNTPQGRPITDAYVAMFRNLRRIVAGVPGLDRHQCNARTHLLLSIVNTLRNWMDRFEPNDYERVADMLSDMFLQGLALQPKRWTDAPGPEQQWPAPVVEPNPIREAFLQAATTLINHEGYRGASVDRIAARLNLTKGSFYHHHASKDDLVAQCFERSFEVIRQTQNLAFEQLDTGWERLLASTRALVQFQMSAQGPLLRATARSALAQTTRHLTERHLDQLTQRFGFFIVDGMAEGALRPVDAALAADLVSGLVNAASELRWWVPSIQPSNAVALYVRPLFLGLLTP